LDILGKLTQIGSLIDGGFGLNAGSYEYRDLVDVNRSTNYGINLTINLGTMYNRRDSNGVLMLSDGHRQNMIGSTISTEFQFGYTNQKRDVRATIGSGIQTNFDTDGVNRDSSKMVGEWKGTKIETLTINLLTEYWLTDAGLGTFRDQMEDFGINVGQLRHLLTETG
jgi:hypothetical protein